MNCLCRGLITVRRLRSISGILLILFTWMGESWSQAAAVNAAHRHLELLSQAFRNAYQQVQPAVVLVTTTRRWGSLHRTIPDYHPLFPEDREPPGLGSGIIVRADGYILSNYHVINGADSILVTLADRRTFSAAVIGVDSLIDIALLKIAASGLPAARLGDSEELQIGDWVLAIVHPLGMGSTLTHGIVSALRRQARIIDDQYGIESFIQTDAVINPGNSGGPLLNLRGEVVGINTAISTQTGYFMGYGLAVPINLAQEAMKDILKYGRVVRGYLGISMSEVTQEMIQRLGLGLARPQGVYIQVLPGSPAARAGLLDGDLIMVVAGRQVDHPNQVQTSIYRLDPGDRLELTVLRAGVRQQVQVVLGEREETQLWGLGKERLSRLGMTVERLSEELAEQLEFAPQWAEQLGFAAAEEAVVVVAVDPDGPAAVQGIVAPAVIIELDTLRITSHAQLIRALSRFEAGEHVLFWLWQPHLGIDLRALAIPE